MTVGGLHLSGDAAGSRDYGLAEQRVTMTSKTVFVVQTFELKRKRLVPGKQEIALTQSGALKKAEALATRIPGAAAISMTVDDETGEVERATLLGTFGEIPDDFAETLTGG